MVDPKAKDSTDLLSAPSTDYWNVAGPFQRGSLTAGGLSILEVRDR